MSAATRHDATPPDASRPRPAVERSTWFLVLIGAAAFAGRALLVLLTRRGADTCGRIVCGDAFYYSTSADLLARGHLFEKKLPGTTVLVPAADHPPLTTIVLAPANLVAWRQSVLAQRLVMAALGAVVVVLVGVLARRLAGHRAGIAAAVIAALNPNLWMNDVLVMSETVGALCLVLTLLAVYRFIDRPSVGRAGWVGVAIGVSALARAELLLLLPVTFVPVALWTRTARSLPVAARLGRVAAATALTLGVLAPWVAFNAARFERPVLLSTNDGLTLVGANCDKVYGVGDGGGVGFWNLSCAEEVDAEVPAGADDAVASAIYRDVALRYVADHKRLLPTVVAVRLARGWGVYAPDQMVWLNQNEGRDSWASWAGYVVWWLLLVPAVAGAVVLHRRRVPIWPLVSTAVVVTLTLAAFYGIVRFRLPADVSATALAGVATAAALGRRRSRPQPAGEAADVTVGAP